MVLLEAVEDVVEDLIAALFRDEFHGDAPILFKAILAWVVGCMLNLVALI